MTAYIFGTIICFIILVYGIIMKIFNPLEPGYKRLITFSALIFIAYVLLTIHEYGVI